MVGDVGFRFMNFHSSFCMIFWQLFIIVLMSHCNLSVITASTVCANV